MKALVLLLYGCGTIADADQADRAQRLCRHMATMGTGAQVDVCTELAVGAPLVGAVPILPAPDALGLAAAAGYSGGGGPWVDLSLWRRGSIHRELLLHMRTQYNISLTQGHREPTHNEGGLIKAMKQEMGGVVTPGMVRGAIQGLVKQGQVREVVPGIYQLIPGVPPED